MQDRSRSTGHRGKEVRGVTLPRDRLIVALDVPVLALSVPHVHWGACEEGVPPLGVTVKAVCGDCP